jgi:hypothetical protein
VLLPSALGSYPRFQQAAIFHWQVSFLAMYTCY